MNKVPSSKTEQHTEYSEGQRGHSQRCHQAALEKWSCGGHYIFILLVVPGALVFLIALTLLASGLILLMGLGGLG
eukprot:4756808-Amphidinium_carterae.1